jgi:hypothetical protein
MTSPQELKHAYDIGRQLALSDHQEKVAFLGGIGQAGKWLLGMGHLGAKGSTSAKYLSAHHIGMPIGFGLLGAATAEEGQGMEGFAKGLAGGLVFNAAMPIGGFLGKRLLAPGFGGKNTAGLMKGMGFTDDAAKQMSASQTLNKPLHTGTGSLSRQLEAGTASAGQLRDLRSNFLTTTRGINRKLSPELKAQAKQLRELLKNKNLSGAQQAELKKLYSQFASELYKGGYSTGSGAARAMLKGTRFAKGLGTMAGGMGLGMVASHQVESMMDTHPASVFDARGGH